MFHFWTEGERGGIGSNLIEKRVKKKLGHGGGKVKDKNKLTVSASCGQLLHREWWLWALVPFVEGERAIRMGSNLIEKRSRKN